MKFEKEKELMIVIIGFEAMKSNVIWINEEIMDWYKKSN